MTFWFWLTASTVVAYLVSILLLAHALRAKHAETWISLGSPSLLNLSVINSLRLFGFVFVGGKYRDLNDQKITTLIWTTRILFAVSLIAIVSFGLYQRSLRGR